MSAAELSLRARLLDLLSVPVMLACAPFVARMARARSRAPRSRAVFDRHGIAAVPHHYYDPVVFPSDIRGNLALERRINGFDLNESGQLALIGQFKWREELLALPAATSMPLQFAYNNASFGSGDAEILYNMIRHFKPSRLIEIGSGSSTLLAHNAIGRNARDGSPCELTCIEPFEHSILDRLGLNVVRKKVEDCPDDLFTALEANDILFIDSSHAVRPQGDVTHEFLYLLGLLKPGVIVHVHDIFTPRDYPAEWVLGERWMWHEQYLLEAFLCFNPAFEVICAVNWLANNHREKLADACPVLCREPGRQPASFWIRRRM